MAHQPVVQTSKSTWNDIISLDIKNATDRKTFIQKISNVNLLKIEHKMQMYDLLGLVHAYEEVIYDDKAEYIRKFYREVSMFLKLLSNENNKRATDIEEVVIEDDANEDEIEGDDIKEETIKEELMEEEDIKKENNGKDPKEEGFPSNANPPQTKTAKKRTGKTPTRKRGRPRKR